MLTTAQLRTLQERAYRWWEWAAAIRAADELKSATDHVNGYIPLLDTSEVVEYARPSSLQRTMYPTRLDLALNIIFEPGRDVYMSGPHAQEIRGVARDWALHLAEASEQLKRILRRLENSPELAAVRKQVVRLTREGVKVHAEEVVRLLSDNYRWLFLEARIRPAGFFQVLLERLCVPSGHELELPDEWEYRPNYDNIAAWQKRLDATGLGKRETGPNLVDAYALDQLEQVARHRRAKRLPILLTHSGKIFDALRSERDRDPDFFRIHGISLVQPPQMALVLRLRADAEKNGRFQEVTAELARQQARGEALSDLLRSMKPDPKTNIVATESSYDDFERELAEFEKNWDQWDALQQILQTVEGQGEAPGMLEGLTFLLEEVNLAEPENLERLLKEELDDLITELDRLQGEIANRLSPPEVPGTKLELKPEDADAMTTLVLRFRVTPTVASAANPIGAFRFGHPEIVKRLTEIKDLLDIVRDGKDGESRELELRNKWRDLHRLDLEDNPEFFLLLAVLYLFQERWMQAIDMANQGLSLLAKRNGGGSEGDEAARAELLLVRAGAGRAFVHSVRMDFPATCEAFLREAIEDCLTSLETQKRNGAQHADARCLREIAVILCSGHDPVYGPKSAYQLIEIQINPHRYEPWIGADADAHDPLRLAVAFARKAYEQKGTDPVAGTLFVNTYLYVMTEIDRRTIDNNGQPEFERERHELAKILSENHKDDPNLLDTLMWHEFVLAKQLKKAGGDGWRNAAKHAEKFAETLDAHSRLRNRKNQYYQRLVELHQERVRHTLAGTERPPV